MRLAIKKSNVSGELPSAGYHYFMHPKEIETDIEAGIYEAMGNIIVDVHPEIGKRLLREASAALDHEIEISKLADAAEQKRSK